MAVPLLDDGRANPEWIIKLIKERDSIAGKIRAFYLTGQHVRPHVHCWNPDCKLPRRGAIQLTSEGRYKFAPLVFCYFCNRTNHVLCENHDLEEFVSLKAPYECLDCVNNPNNDHRKAFFNQTKYKRSCKHRRELFISEINDNEDYATDGEFDDRDKECFDMNEEGNYTITQKPDIDEVLRHMNLTAEDDAAKLKFVCEENARLRVQVEQDKQRSQNQIDSLSELLKKLQEQIEEVKKVPPKERLSDFYNTRKPDSSPVEAFEFRNSFGAARSTDQTPKRAPRSEENSESNAGKSNPAPSATDAHEKDQFSSNDANLLGVMNRFAVSQERIEREQQLSNLRKAMPKLTEFNGDAYKWLEFQQDVERYRSACKYDNDTIKLHVRGALKGEAFDAVRDVFDMLDLEEIMAMLKETFGDPMVLVRRKAKDIREAVIPSVMYREDAIKLKIILQSYFAACKYAKTGNLNSNELGEKIYNQFSSEDKARCKELFLKLYPGQQIVICLNVIYEYVSSRMLILDEKPNKKEDKKSNKPIQINAVASFSNQSSSNKNEAWKFEIRDKRKSPYCGYDLDKVNQIAKKCEICNRNNHYTPECRQYQAMDFNQRSNVIAEKRVCRNCLITSGHRASECDLKLGCGTKVNRTDKCTQKHHQSLHGINFNPNTRHNSNRGGRRSGTNTNSRNATQLLNNLQNQQVVQTAQTQIRSNESQVSNINNQNSAQTALMNGATHFHTQNPRDYNIQQNNVSLEGNDSPRTVKMFKHKFFGPKGFTVAFSIGDSAAEGTLVRDDLRRALGIEGVPHELNLGWTDGSIKKCMGQSNLI